jgi:hypothetical protein
VPPSNYFWNADHPTAKTVRLADGTWHTVIGMRICDEGEVHFGLPPAPQDGTYLEEVISTGPPVPPWKFA